MFFGVPYRAVTTAQIGWWDTKRSAITTVEGGVQHGYTVTNVDDLSPNDDDASQATESLSPLIDLNTAPGVALLSTTNADRLEAQQDAPITAFMVIFHLPGVPAERALMGRDATGASSGPAIDARIIA